MIVLWRVTTLCNLACGFCAYDRRVPMQRVQMAPAEVERFAALLGAWREATGEDVLLSWLGGEPLLWPGVLDLSRRLRETHGVRVSVTTNGTTLLRKGNVGAVAAAFDEVTVSVDALEAQHERLRGWAGGWSKLAEGIGRLREESDALRLRANVVLMRDTLAAFPALCDQLAEWGVDEITFNQLGGRDRPEFFPSHSLGLAHVAVLRNLLPELVERMATRGVRLCANNAYIDRFEAKVSGRAVPVEDCESVRPSIFIDEHGRIASCSFTLDAHGFSTRDFLTVGDVAGLRQRLLAQRRARPAAICGDCPSTQVFAKFGT
jgi:MoaA/NifB/PqqE/SkfB family radical SAM enzyme